MRGRRQRPDRLESRLAWPQESLAPLAAYSVVMNIAEQAHSVERAEDVLLLAPRGDAVLEKEPFHFRSGQHVPRKDSKQPLNLQLANERGDLGEVFLGDLGGGLVDDLLEAKLA